MKKMIEKPNQSIGNKPGCIKISDAPGLHLYLQNPNQCFWLYFIGRHDVSLGDYPATSKAEAIERTSLADINSDSISPNLGLSKASVARELVAYQRFISNAHANGLIKNDDAVQLNRIIDQMKQAQAKSNPAVDYHLIPIVMSTLTLQEDIASKTMEFSILTSTRLNDLIRLKWKDLDLKAGCIKLSSGLTAQHLVPLSKSALKLLEGLPRTGDYIFDTEEDEPLSANRLISTARKIGVKVTSSTTRAAFRAWVLTSSDSNLLLSEFEQSGYLNGGRRCAIESLQTPGVMKAWSDFCYSRV